MGIFDGDFGSAEAAIIGGIMGFAEESLREENKSFEDIDVDNLASDPRINENIDLAAFRQAYPALFKYILATVVMQKYKLARDRRREEDDLEEVKHELEALAETESLLTEED